jgi:phospholipid/cholesterol/gamma-HCH transport system substrate-binding protein
MVGFDAMAERERSIELKVGILILVSFVILGGFILVMTGLSFQSTYALYVDFDNPGGLQTGALVRIAGVKVGKVTELAFRGGAIDPQTHRRTLVRATLRVEERVRASIHEDADFYVTTQGVLGEQFLSIDPGSPDKPVMKDGAIVKGVDPPRLDLFLAKAYELLDTVVTGVRDNRELIRDVTVGTAGLLKNLNGVLTDNRDRITRTLANVEELTIEAKRLTEQARTNYVDNPKIARSIDNIDRLTSDLQRDTGPLLKDAREAAANLDRLSATVGSTEQAQKLQKTVEEVVQLVSRANATVGDTQAIVAHIKKGEGTAGALVMDEEMYDDLQSLVRDLKHNPWKFFWKQ